MSDRNDSVPFMPTLPDVSTTEPSRAFRSDSYIAFFVKDVKPWSARAGGVSFLNYRYVLFVSNEKAGPLYFVTLETSVLGTKCLGIFDSSNSHQNLGRDNSLDDERAFVAKALSLVETEFGEKFTEMQRGNSAAQNESTTRKKSWLGRLIGG